MYNLFFLSTHLLYYIKRVLAARVVALEDRLRQYKSGSGKPGQELLGNLEDAVGEVHHRAEEDSVHHSVNPNTGTGSAAMGEYGERSKDHATLSDGDDL